MTKYKTKSSGIETALDVSSEKMLTVVMEDRIPIIEFSGEGWSGADIRTILVRLPKAYRHLNAEKRKSEATKLEPALT